MTTRDVPGDTIQNTELKKDFGCESVHLQSQLLEKLRQEDHISQRAKGSLSNRERPYLKKKVYAIK